MSSPRSDRSISLFEQSLDVVVLGGGYIGFAAVRRLVAQGRRVLLIEPTGQLLWESSRALESEAAGPAGCAEWRRWLEELEECGAASGEWFDPAFAEILAARAWSGQDEGERVRVLCYARPVAVEPGEAGIASLTVATKSGLRVLRARHWVDASEGGVLAALCDPSARGAARAPVGALHSVVLQAVEPARENGALARFCAEAGFPLSGSIRAGEHRVSWPAGQGPWHLEMLDFLKRLRASVPLAEHVVSHLSAEPFPLYAPAASAAVDGLGLPGNLLVLSPALSAVGLESVGERFAWGIEAVLGWPRAEPEHAVVPEWIPGAAVGPESAVARTLSYDVVVAGSGTAGSLAAISAAREGAETCVVDFASFPGGVGTGGGITGYFYGLEGGLQAETDAVTIEMNRLLDEAEPTSHRWHHEGKKLALLACFGRHGVVFHGGTLLCGVEKDEAGRVHALLAATDDGLVRIRGRAFVDSTGDGDLCAQAGASFDTGRAGDGRSLAYSQSAFVLRKAARGGLQVAPRNFDAGWVDPADPEDLSRARLLGVAQHWRARWSEACPLAIAPLPGLRQSRHVHTDRTLTFRDLAGGKRFADAIGEAGSIADTHSVDYEFEDDEAVFFFWVCRLFRRPLRCELPYRMLLPRGLDNVWIACRASGIAPTAFYAVRMQRDMQRLGEAAGVAAALAARDRRGSRGIGVSELQGRLGFGAGRGAVSVSSASTDEAADDARRFAAGQPGAHLWRMYCASRTARDAALAVLRSGGRDASFYAAALLAMWADASAEPRLLEAVAEREDGPPPSADNTGAHGQEIDIPFWLIAVILLRRCGTEACLPALEKLAAAPDNLLNVRTAIALTLERLAADGRVPPRRAFAATNRLLEHPIPDRLLAPSHSIWRRLRGEVQLVLRNDCGADTRQDHAWQLHLVVGRIGLAAGVAPDPRAATFLDDSRAVVRQAFAKLFAGGAAEAATAGVVRAPCRPRSGRHVSGVGNVVNR